MNSFLSRIATKTSVPLVAAYLSQSNKWNTAARNDAGNDSSSAARTENNESANMNQPEVEYHLAAVPVGGGMRADESGEYHGLFPRRQLWQPRLEYPLWDVDWDGLELPSSGDKEIDRRRQRLVRKTGITRHIILVRHGQYDEAHKADESRKLTELGKLQADFTGRRLAEMVKGAEDDFGPCHVVTLRVSGMTRAKETAEIIASYLPGAQLADPDPLLNEGRPCHNIPGAKATAQLIELTDRSHPRIEQAYRKYFFRDSSAQFGVLDSPTTAEEGGPNPQDQDNNMQERHVFEVIVCHANVIRYFLCRSLQLPPEAWLRFCPLNCSLTYLTIRPTGTVSCRMMGDIGHLPYSMATFSNHHGFTW